MKVGIIGLGFVGSSIKNAYDIAKIDTVCSDPAKGIVCLTNELLNTDAIFICVPSPQLENGQCNTDILETVLESLKDYKNVIISKVTAPPSVYARLFKKYNNLTHAPEFLVAATAKEDYLNGTFSIIGGEPLRCQQALSIVKLGQPNINQHVFCKIDEASLSKYTINSFLASKVIFMNQIKNLTDALKIDYDVISSCISMDNRIGNSHLQVPGPDGQFGFGGACFPKDTSALKFEADSLGVDLTVLTAVIESNKKIRK